MNTSTAQRRWGILGPELLSGSTTGVLAPGAFVTAGRTLRSGPITEEPRHRGG